MWTSKLLWMLTLAVFPLTDAVAQCNITNLERCKVCMMFCQVLQRRPSTRHGLWCSLRHDQWALFSKLQTMHGPPNNSFKFDLEVRLTSQNFVNHTYNSLTFCKYFRNKVDPRVFIQCKPTPGMYMRVDSQLLLLWCNTPVKYICLGYIPAKRDVYVRSVGWSQGSAKGEAGGTFN